MVVTVSVSKRQPRKPPQQQPGNPAQPAKPATPKPEEPDGGPGPEPVPGHNGGRSQLNFNFISGGKAYPFLNVLKTAQRWDLRDNSGPPAPDTLDDNGYPVTYSAGGVKCQMFIPSAAARLGNWRLRWRGQATALATGMSSQTATDGDFTFTPGTSSIELHVVSGSATHFEIFHEDDEVLLDAGAVFNPDFLAILRNGNWGVLRFLDWQQNNTTNVRYWADRKPVDYFSYNSNEFRASIYGGVTTNVGDAWSVGAPPDWEGLVDKAMVTVRFNASGTTDTPTLSVGGTPAKVMKNSFSNPITAGGNSRPMVNRYATLMYDADLDAWIKQGGDGALNSQFLVNACPIEIMLALCEEVGAHPWFCTPAYACDPVTDWITGLATYMRDNAPAWMIPRYETPNEIWNNRAGFHTAAYALNKSEAHWPGAYSGLTSNWAGKAASLVGQAVSAVYADDRDRYCAVVGVQTAQASTTLGQSMTNWNPILASTLYVSQDGGEPACDWVTHIACANYYRDNYTAAEENAAGDAYVAADTAGKLTIATDDVATALVDDGTSEAFSTIPRYLNVTIPNWKAWAQDYNPALRITFYEGGWSPDYDSDAENNALRAGTRMVAELDQITIDFYEGLVALGDVEFPSHYYLSGTGVWALYDPDVYATPSPQYDAIVTFNTP